EVALVLLSPHSVPKVWSREKWEPVFFQKPAELGSLLGFVLLEACPFPKLLKGQRFFDATGNFEAEARRIRRWLLRPEVPARPDGVLTGSALDLRARVGERPGFAWDVDHLVADEFAAACKWDFEAVHRVDCLGRTRAGILGDLGHLVQLRLAGIVEQNRETLVEWCRNHRRLFLFTGVAEADRDFLHFGGRVSAIFAVNAPARERASFEAIHAALFAVPRDEDVCAAMLGDAALCATGLLESDFEAGSRLGWMLVSVLRAAERFAEAVETLDVMENAARGRGDEGALQRILRERSWLCETSADEVIGILPTAGPEVTQLGFQFV
ncbi:MAG: hypothetical protein QOJ99_2918, partial [Bryobacterales bacterium]|nr:hypothetical protein [Bryobacterales bacterium]